MKQIFQKLLFVLVVTGFNPMLMAADWQISGSNTIRLETYDSNGLQSASPYPFEGGQLYDELYTNFSLQNSPYESWRGQIYGLVWNESAYRAVDRGLVPERLSLVHEKGDVALPYRISLGDYFANLSFLTLHRSLKGAQIELQPHTDGWGNRHSILLFAGENDFRWKDLDLGDDFSSGASWLISGDWLGTANFNFVYNFKDNNTATGAISQDQFVISAGIEKEFKIFAHNLTIETEYAHMMGDHNATAFTGNGQDRNGNGYYFELRGQHDELPFDYRFRHDYYDKDFIPAGAVVTANRKSFELHGAWHFDSGIKLRGRVQDFSDNFDNPNTRHTRTGGLNISGPFNFWGITGLSSNIDGYVQDIETDNKTTNLIISTINANFNKALTADWNGRLGIFIQYLDDHNATNIDQQTYQFTLNVDHSINFAGISGVITPGIQYRYLTDTIKSHDWNPTFAMQLVRGSHSLGFNYSHASQDRRNPGSVDIITETIAINYGYQWQQNTFGVEANLYDREQITGQDTDAYMVGIFWTYAFEKQSRPQSSVPRVAGLGVQHSSKSITADMFDLGPGVLVSDAKAAIVTAGIGGYSRQGIYSVYEYPFLRGIDQRQRLVLEQEADILTGSALIIEFDDVGNRDTVAQTYQRVRKKLIQMYGAPTFNYESGQFTASFMPDVNAKRLIRVDEWQTSRGALRLGIPRRLDGQVRMEIQHRKSFPNPRSTLWSIEGVR